MFELVPRVINVFVVYIVVIILGRGAFPLHSPHLKSHHTLMTISQRKAEWDHINNIISEGFENNNSKPFWNYMKYKSSAT
jgi:hypothetical protein